MSSVKWVISVLVWLVFFSLANARDYDAGTGRYLQPDKLDTLSRTIDPELLLALRMNGQRLQNQMRTNHLYGYVDQNPVNKMDPTGLWGVPTFSPTGGVTGMGQVNAAGGKVAGQEAAISAGVAATGGAYLLGGTPAGAKMCKEARDLACASVLGLCLGNGGQLDDFFEQLTQDARSREQINGTRPPPPTTSLPQ